jgi:hypothetical protein
MSKECHLTTCKKAIVDEVGSAELRIFKKSGKVCIYFDSQQHLIEWLTQFSFAQAAA